jgi:hypothetical protein
MQVCSFYNVDAQHCDDKNNSNPSVVSEVLSRVSTLMLAEKKIYYYLSVYHYKLK